MANITKVFNYGALIPKDHEQQLNIKDQLWLANKYYNKLVEIHNNALNSIEQIIIENCPELNELNESVDNINKSISELRAQLKDKKERESNEDQKSIIKQIDLLKKEQNSNYKKIKEIRKSFYETNYKKCDIEYKEKYKELLNKKAKELEKEKLGPNDPNLNLIKQSVFNEMNIDENKIWIKRKTIENEVGLSNKEARKNSKCFSGVYLPIEEAFNKSKKDSKGKSIKFKRFDGTGKIGIQLAPSLQYTKAFSGMDPRLKIQINEDKEIRTRRFNKKNKPVPCIAMIKLCGTKNNAKFIDVPFILHRPFPEDAVLTWVYLTVKKVGYNFKYELQFTVNTTTKDLIVKNKNIAINLNWSSNKDGTITIANTYDGENYKQFSLPSTVRERLEKSRSILGHNDKHFDQLKKWLKQQCNEDILNKINDVILNKDNERKEVILSNIISNINNILKIKNAKKVIYIVNNLISIFEEKQISETWKLWRDERLNNSTKLDLYDDPDNIVKWFVKNTSFNEFEIFVLILEWWRRKNEHLTNYARNLEQKSTRLRQEIYRKIASELGNNYDKVIINKCNLSEIAKNPDPEVDKRDQQEEKANSVRQIAGVSILKTSLKNKFGKDNFIETDVDKYLTHKVCGEKFDKSKLVDVYCKKCNKMFDKNENLLHHLLQDKSSSEVVQ
jgi:hypothetical protein